MVHDLKRKAGLTVSEREHLEDSLCERAVEYEQRVDHLCSDLHVLKVLPLDDNISEKWSKMLSTVRKFTEDELSRALHRTGIENANPQLPVEGILLMFRLGQDQEANKKIASVKHLLEQIEKDSLCSYLLVLALDADEVAGDAATELVQYLNTKAKQSDRCSRFIRSLIQ